MCERPCYVTPLRGVIIRKGRRKQPQQRVPDLRVNNQIRCREVRVIDDQGQQLGIMHPKQAYDLARDRGLDLVEVSPTARPPVCKFLDYGRFKYEAQKKSKEVKAKQKSQDIREVQFRPKINEHDYQVKARTIARLIESGSKVKVTLRFRGREVVHSSLGRDILTRVQEDLAEKATVESKASMEGRSMVMVLAPKE